MAFIGDLCFSVIIQDSQRYMILDLTIFFTTFILIFIVLTTKFRFTAYSAFVKTNIMFISGPIIQSFEYC